MSGTVTDAKAKHRFELEEEGGTAFVTYLLEGEKITFTHTIVPEALEGRGMGSKLIRGALDEARERGLKVGAGLLVREALCRDARRVSGPARLTGKGAGAPRRRL
jgi:predicted GNAT family acetyltransferase